MTDCKLWTLEINIEGRQFFCPFILLNSVRVYWHLMLNRRDILALLCFSLILFEVRQYMHCTHVTGGSYQNLFLYKINIVVLILLPKGKFSAGVRKYGKLVISIIIFSHTFKMQVMFPRIFFAYITDYNKVIIMGITESSPCQEQYTILKPLFWITC